MESGAGAPTGPWGTVLGSEEAERQGTQGGLRQ